MTIEGSSSVPKRGEEEALEGVKDSASQIPFLLLLYAVARGKRDPF